MHADHLGDDSDALSWIAQQVALFVEYRVVCGLRLADEPHQIIP